MTDNTRGRAMDYRFISSLREIHLLHVGGDLVVIMAHIQRTQPCEFTAKNVAHQSTILFLKKEVTTVVTMETIHLVLVNCY